MITRILILAFVFLLPMVPTFWAIIDVAKRAFSDFRIKVIWLAIVTFIPVFGALLYFFYGRKKYTISMEAKAPEDEIDNAKGVQ